MAKIKVGYINLYSHGTDYLHWAGSIYSTKEKALKSNDKNKSHCLGEVFIEAKLKKG